MHAIFYFILFKINVAKSGKRHLHATQLTTMHIKLLHTKLNTTVKLNTTIIKEATASI